MQDIELTNSNVYLNLRLKKMNYFKTCPRWIPQGYDNMVLVRPLWQGCRTKWEYVNNSYVQGCGQ